ncbi:MAG: glycosyltransferase family 4 protein [bacterium]
MTRIRMVHVRDSSGIYGAERVILGTSVWLRSMNVEPAIVSVLSGSRSGMPLIEESRRLGLRAEALPARHTLDLRAIGRLRGILKAWRPHVVHAHDLRSAVFGLTASIGLPLATVATAHGSTCESLRKRAYLTVFERHLLPRFDRVHAVSASLAGHLRAAGVPAGKIRIIPNGVDEAVVVRPAGSNPLEPLKGSPTLGVVGRLTVDKGLTVLLRALASLKGALPGIRVLLAGSGPQEEALRREARRLEIADRVTFCGRVSPVAWVYHAADLVVIPSLREGLPCVLLEAMMAARPVVATRVGAIPQVLAQGELGRLVPPSDAEALARAILEACRDGSASREMAEKAQAVARGEYSARIMSARIRALYEELAPAKTAGTELERAVES